MVNITKLEKAREEKGLSIKELAERVYEMDKEMYIFQEMLNIHEAENQKYTKDFDSHSMANVVLWSKILGCSIADIYGRENDVYE